MATGLPLNRLGIITDVHDPDLQPQQHQQQLVPVTTDQSAPPASATHDNNSAIAKNNLLDWSTLEAQDSVIDPSPCTVPIYPGSILSDVSAKSSGSYVVPVSHLSNAPSAENTSSQSQHKCYAVASQIARSITGTPTNTSNSRKRESDPLVGDVELISHGVDGGPILAIPRTSRTMDSLRDFLLTFRYSNRSLDERHWASLDENYSHGFRRGRSWLISRPRIFNHLEDQLKAAMEPSYLEHRNFLPRGKLYQLVTKRSVEKEVARRKHHAQKRFQTQRGPDSIPIEESKPRRRWTHIRSRSAPELSKRSSRGTYRMIFAILVFIRQPLGIWSFIEEGVSDADLPLEEVELRVSGHSRLDLRSKRNLFAPLRCFKNWEDGAIKDFAEHQWVFLAPVFEKSEEESVPHLKLHPRHILPFTRTPLERGGFGQLYKTSIHPDHHNFERALVCQPKLPLHKRLMEFGKSHLHYDLVAVKELLPRKEGAGKTKKAFEAESRILRNLSRIDHMSHHLITLLATYEQEGRYFLIFPWADKDLEQYWEETLPEPGMAKWLINQCYGLADGLSHVHHYLTMLKTTMEFESSVSERTSITSPTPSNSLTLYGRHGDIKPKNILWFRDQSNGGYGTLKITDFGIAQFTSDNTESARRKGIVPNSYTYRSPECDFPDAEISPQCDIWALGCVYLVFMTWYFGGWNYVQTFASRRKANDYYWPLKATSDTFFTITENKSGTRMARVKDSVVLMIGELRSHRACNNDFRELLKVVQQEMLIIQRPDTDRHLQVSGQEIKRRISSGNLALKLGPIRTNPPEN